MKKTDAATLLLLLLLVVGSVLAGEHLPGSTPCSSGSGDTATSNRQQKLSLTILNIELITLSLCETDSPRNHE